MKYIKRIPKTIFKPGDKVTWRDPDNSPDYDYTIGQTFILVRLDTFQKRWAANPQFQVSAQHKTSGWGLMEEDLTLAE